MDPPVGKSIQTPDDRNQLREAARPGRGAAAGAAPAVPDAAGTTGAAALTLAWAQPHGLDLEDGWAQPAGAGALAGFPSSSAAAAAHASGPGTSMLSGGADAAAGGGGPDWRSNIAVAASGPEGIAMSEDWWKKTAKAVKGSTRLKERGIRNEDNLSTTEYVVSSKNLSTMFEDLRGNSDDHWSASSGVAPSQGNLSGENSSTDEGEADNDDDSELEDVTSTNGGGKRGRLNTNIKGKKPKTSMDHWFQEQMDKLVKMNERINAAFESIASNEDKSRDESNYR